MNRRQFSLGLGALFGAPKIPVAMPALFPAAALEHFNTAKLISRAHNKCSPEFLMRHLRVDAELAKSVETMLIKRNVITMPGLDGVSRAINPMDIPTLKADVPKPMNAPSSEQDGIKEKLLKQDNLSLDQSTQPDTAQDHADDAIPASHRDTNEIPRDVITANDGRG